MTKWLAALLSLAGAFLVAGKVYPIGYVCFILGSGLWAIIGYRANDRALYSMNAIFLTANLWGMYNVIH